MKDKNIIFSNITNTVFIAGLVLIYCDKLSWQAVTLFVFCLAWSASLNLGRKKDLDLAPLKEIEAKILNQQSELNKLNLKLGFNKRE